MDAAVIYVNGKQFRVTASANERLLWILREKLHLTGTKYGCGEGQCGACTVLVDGVATRSCVARLEAVAGKNITTIEALAPPGALHPVQQAFLDVEAFQCGYCTPGMVMAAAGLLAVNASPSEQDIATAMDRNVCRCGTFPRIVRAVQLAAQRMKSPSPAGERR